MDKLDPMEHSVKGIGAGPDSPDSQERKTDGDGSGVRLSRRKLLASLGLTGAAVVSGGLLHTLNGKSAPDSGQQPVAGLPQVNERIGTLPYGANTPSLWEEIWKRGVNPEWFGAVADWNDETGQGTDNHAAFQQALDTGLNVYVPKGKYRIHEKELLFVTPGQKMYGAGMGSSHGPNSLPHHESVTDLVFTGAGTRYVKTRRQPRLGAGDPMDAPLSTAINIQHDGVQLEDMAIRLYCNYNNNLPTNLGEEWDVGVFVGGREQFRARNLRIMGYWRVASLYYDQTHAHNLPKHRTPDGIAYPASRRSGVDQSYLENIYARGGWKGLFIAGAIETGTTQYYDELAGGLVEDHRGRAGAGDFHSLNCTFWNAEHHSGQRFYDPVQPLNFEAENLDAIPAAVCIDGRGFGVERQLLRRLLFTNLRVRNTEAYRIALGRVQELYFFSLHTELGDGLNVTDTSGNPIDFDNEDPVSGKNYGPIAIKESIVAESRKYGIYIYGMNFRKPVPRWFQEVVPSYEILGQSHEARSDFNRLTAQRLDVLGNLWTKWVRPDADNEHLLGTAAARWRNIYTMEVTASDRIRSNNFLFSGMHRPIDDNVHNMGSAASRWKTVFAGDGVINTSDRNAKQQIAPIPDQVLDAWAEVEFYRFKYNDAVAEKGARARWHIGVIAQEIRDAFARHGLDAMKYGLLCYDEWNDEFEEVMDENNRLTGEKRLVQQAGARWSVRFDECQFLEMALTRRELRRMRGPDSL